jgi:DNA repair exonuclease SbcCD ATPase subunit
MTTELWATLIGALVLLLTNSAAAVKLWGDMQKTKADRLSTKEARDQDSAALHDQCMKNSWDITQLKDMSGHRDQVIEQLQQQISILNSTMAATNVKLDTLTEAIKELKK